MRFETATNLALEAAFDGGRLTSDGGLLWLAKADAELGLCEAISEHLPEWRRRKARHSAYEDFWAGTPETTCWGAG